MSRLRRDGRHGSLEEGLSINIIKTTSTKGNDVRNSSRQVVGVDGAVELHISRGYSGEVDVLKGLLLGKRVEVRREGSLVVPAHPVVRYGKLVGVDKDGRER